MNPALKRRSLLWWFTIIFFLAIGGPSLYHRFQNTTRKRDSRRTVAVQIKVIGEALEAYRNENGTYPRPAGGSQDPMVQAKMLYQALTGDGTDCIDGVPAKSSDGNPGTDGELILEGLILPGGSLTSFLHREDLYLIDPWGRPFHYRRGDEQADTVNKTTFDLWSEGSVTPNPDRTTWIGNW